MGRGSALAIGSESRVCASSGFPVSSLIPSTAVMAVAVAVVVGTDVIADSAAAVAAPAVMVE